MKEAPVGSSLSSSSHCSPCQCHASASLSIVCQREHEGPSSATSLDTLELKDGPWTEWMAHVSHHANYLVTVAFLFFLLMSSYLFR